MLLSYVGYSPYVTVEGHPILGHPTQLQVLPASHPLTHTQSFSPKLSQQIYKYINTSEAPSHQVELRWLRNSSVHLTSQVEMLVEMVEM